MTRLIYVLLIMGFAGHLSGQYYSYKQLIDHADASYEKSNYIEAMKYYTLAEEQNDLDEESIYNYAESAYKTYSLDLATEMYTKYIEDEPAPDVAHHVRYKMANIHLLKGHYQNALTDFDLFLSEYSEVDSTLTKEVIFLKSSAEWAIKQPMISDYDKFFPVDEVNSPYSEHAPQMVDDQIYYSALRYRDEDIGYDLNSQIVKGQDVVKIGGLSKKKMISHPSLSADGKLLFFTLGEYVDTEKIRCEIYYSRRDGSGHFTSAVRLPDNINNPQWTTTHPHIVVESDGAYTLYFASDRYGTQGGLDIWKVSVSEGMDFDAPLNLKGLNTEKDDVSPFYDKEKEIIYFSSMGRLGFGGYDVYQAEVTGDGFGEIENLGAQVNSPNNDLYFSLSEDGSTALLASNRPGSQYLDSKFETCCYDIYKGYTKACKVDFELITVDAISNAPIGMTTVTFYDKKNNEVILTTPIDSSSQVIQLPCDKDLEVKVEKPGYETSTIDLGRIEGIAGDENKISRTIALKPLEYQLQLKVIEVNTNGPLTNTDIYLTELGTNQVIERLNNASHEISFPIEPNKKYLLEVNKEGYKETIIEFTSGTEESIVERVAALRLLDVVEKAVISLENSIPVSLYFDNDQPDSGTLSTSSTVNYTQSYNKYYDRKEKFRQVYLSKFSKEDQVIANNDLESLFESDIKGGYNNYEKFKKQLLLVLENGQEANIYLRGFASPVAASDYNTALGRRRIDSVRKEFYQWRSGVLVKYIDSGQLKITERSFGETTSPTHVSDNINSPAQSIYSPEASRERRVEIDEIQFNKN